MAHRDHYVPAISRPLVAALYHEAKARKQPMTKLTDELLTSALIHTAGYKRAAKDWPELADTQRQDRQTG